MDYLYIGKFVDTHGIKGELRLLLDDLLIYDISKNIFLSHDELIKLLFMDNLTIYVGYNKEELTITSYRHHKMYEMLTFKGYTNINEVLKYKKEKCYIKNELNNNLVSLNTLINYEINYQDKNYGKIIDYQNNNGNIVLKIQKEKEYFIPFNSNFIKNIDKINNKITVENIEGLIL